MLPVSVVDRVARIGNELRSLRDQERRLVKLFQFGEVNEDFLRQQIRSLRARQEQLEAETCRLQELEKTARELDEVETKVTDWTQRIRANLESLSFDERRLVLDALDVTVVVTGVSPEARLLIVRRNVPRPEAIGVCRIAVHKLVD